VGAVRLFFLGASTTSAETFLTVLAGLSFVTGAWRSFVARSFLSGFFEFFSLFPVLVFFLSFSLILAPYHLLLFEG